jgi:hypothetical protein
MKIKSNRIGGMAFAVCFMSWMSSYIGAAWVDPSMTTPPIGIPGLRTGIFHIVATNCKCQNSNIITVNTADWA